MALLIGGTLALLFLDLPWSAVVIALLVAVEVVEFRIWRWAARQLPKSGTERLAGDRGTLLEGSRVRIGGTTYRAEVLEGAPGDRVLVERVEGMTLVVRRVEAD